MAAFAIALVTRLLVGLELEGSAFMRYLLGDAYTAFELAQRIAADRAIDAPGGIGATPYPLLLSAIVSNFGAKLVWIHVVQSIVGALGALLVTATAGKLFSRAAAWIAAVVAGAYAPWVWSDYLVHETAFAMVLAAAFAWFLVTRPTVWAVLSAGVVLGLLVLLREHAILLALAVIPWVGLKEKRGIAIFAVGLLAVLGGWIAHHRHHGGHGMWPSNSAGVDFYIGNAANASGGYVPLIPRPGARRLENHDAQRIANEALGHTTSPSEASRYWWGQGLESIFDDPKGALWTIAYKARRATSPGEPLDVDSFDAWADESLTLKLLFIPFSFATLFLFGVLGALLSGDSRSSALPLLSSIGLLVASLLVFYVSSRLRLLLVPFAIPFAAQGVLALAMRFLEGGGRSKLVVIGLLPLPVLLIQRWEVGNPRSLNWSHLAANAFDAGQTEDALAFAQKSLTFDPENTDARFIAGLAFRDLGRNEEALTALELAIEQSPYYAADGLFEVGKLQREAKLQFAAIAAFTRSIELAPDRVPPRLALARALRSENLLDQARKEIGSAIELSNEDPELYLELGRIERAAKNPPRAEAAFRRAYELDDTFAEARLALARMLLARADAEGALELVSESFEAPEALREEFAALRAEALLLTPGPQ